MSRLDLAGALIDFVRVSIPLYFFHADCYNERRGEDSALTYFSLLVGADVPVMTRRPGASLANPNKAARRVTAVEFASDSDGA